MDEIKKRRRNGREIPPISRIAQFMGLVGRGFTPFGNRHQPKNA
jgi:hypothetical protein